MSDTISSLYEALDKQTREIILSSTKDAIDGLLVVIETQRKEFEDVARNGLKLTVKTKDSKHTLTGLKHKSLETLITICANRQPTLMVGMAGTGKTHAAEQVAESLGLDFYAMSVGAQTSKTDIMGFVSANGQYIPTLFRRAYEEGGVFLMDEIDAGNSNVLVQVNAALSNSYCAFPDKMVKKHENFVFVASANTYGFGANRLYVGRNQLDAATLDRFTILNWEIDESLEKGLVKGEESLKWLKVVRECRKRIAKDEVRTLVTPRATLRGAGLLASGVEFEQALELSILNAIPTDKQSTIRELALETWG